MQRFRAHLAIGFLVSTVVYGVAGFSALAIAATVGLGVTLSRQVSEEAAERRAGHPRLGQSDPVTDRDTDGDDVAADPSATVIDLGEARRAAQAASDPWPLRSDSFTADTGIPGLAVNAAVRAELGEVRWQGDLIDALRGDALRSRDDSTIAAFRAASAGVGSATRALVPVKAA